MNNVRMLAAALAACAALSARADNEGVDQGLANAAAIAAAQKSCSEAARDRGLEVRKVERTRMQENGPTTVRLATAGRGDVDCEYDAKSGTTTLLGLPAVGKDVDSGPLVKLCEKAAEQQDIRLGRFDELKPLDGRRTEVRFERPFLGKRHTCLIDRARNLVSFDGGKAVPLPGSTPAKK